MSDRVERSKVAVGLPGQQVFRFFNRIGPTFYKRVRLVMVSHLLGCCILIGWYGASAMTVLPLIADDHGLNTSSRVGVFGNLG